MKHFQDDNYDPMKDYEHSIMHHDDDYDPMNDYEHSIMHHNDDLDDYDGSIVFRHWNEN